MSQPNLTPPPYGAEVDLRGEKTYRLPSEMFGLRTLAMLDARESGVMFRLIARSLTEVPAGSLPNDEEMLIDIAGMRSDVGAWPLVRSKIMFGWQACSDGRLYCTELGPTLQAAARQRGGRKAGSVSTFQKGNTAAAKSTLEDDVNQGQPGLGERRPVRRTDAVPYAVATPSGNVLAFPKPIPAVGATSNQGQPGLGERRPVRRSDAVLEDSLACAPAAVKAGTSFSSNPLNKEVTSRRKEGGVGDRDLRIDGANVLNPTGLGYAEPLTSAPETESNDLAGASPAAAGPGGPTAGFLGGEEILGTSQATDKTAAKGGNPKRGATARLNAALKTAGKSSRKRAVFPCAHFPEKIAYLWNEICWLPYEPLGIGAGRAGPMTPTMIGHLKQRYLSAQKVIHGTTRTITTLEDWAGLFRHISGSKFLMGEMPPAKGSNTSWRISLKWLLESENNFMKVRNGNYHGAANLRAALGPEGVPAFDPALLAAYAAGGELSTEEHDGQADPTGSGDSTAGVASGGQVCADAPE